MFEVTTSLGPVLVTVWTMFITNLSSYGDLEYRSFFSGLMTRLEIFSALEETLDFGTMS